ncbi:U11/U12 small nuclear ribonucleoprotein 48 kDa protein [Lactuca sativa]|nr:U11/U12 small nuclear ribonucleoprotein 48 kDa protein [Lactuca sativa]
MDLPPPSFAILPPPPGANPNPNSQIFPPYNHHHHNNPTTVPTQPPDLHTTLSTLKHLINLSKTTIQSLSNILPTTTPATDAIATCPYNSNHRVPPNSLFNHHLRCPSSPAVIDLALCDSLHYPNSLQAPQSPLNQENNCLTQTLSNDTTTDLCLSLDGYHISLDSNFFYRDCPAVVTFPHDNNKSDCTLTLPAVLSAECADLTGDRSIDINDTIDGLCSSSGLVELLASEYWNIRTEINQWNDYPASYSYSVLRSVLCSYISQKEYLMEWILVNSPFYGVVIDVFMRDHILLLFRLCLKAIAREAAGYLVSISKGDPKDGKFCFQCPVMSRVLTWLASQLAILYGEVNGKVFAISMLKQSLLISASKSLFLFGEQRASKSVNVSKIDGKAVMEHDGRTPWIILVSQVAAAVAALHERFFFETRIRTIRASRFVPVYQRVQEHGYISKMADEERGKRSNYRAIIEHDGVLWHHGGNQDGNKNKSREELLAEERDYKRRRVSYRGKKMKRSTTQVMRDIIDEYMEEIKHAYMAGSGQSSLDSTKLASKASSMNDLDNEAKISKKAVPQSNRKEKDSVSDISMKSSRFGDEIKEKSNRNRDQEYHTSKSRSHDHRKQDEYKHSRKYQKRNEFEDRYDPSKSHDMNHDDL